MRRLLFLVYGVACWVMFLGVFGYGCGFLIDVLVPKAIDGPPVGPLWQALLINASLVGLFGVQHSVMARQGFKRMWTRLVPEPIERSTYVLISNLLMILLFWQWQPMGGTVWEVQNEIGRAAIYALFAIGCLTIPLASFMTNHFDLFGVRQVWLHFKGRSYTPLRLDARGLYRYVRHPLYVGWMIAFWATPTMTVGHLAFACFTTVYMLIAIPLEERDLVHYHGPAYERYRSAVPALVPFTRSGRKAPAVQEAGITS